jgi:alanyl-tRNA synthetase
MALFGEKYGDKVRVVRVGDFSKELCGGTHVSRTGDIGVFKITAESSISAGVRRLEAVTGGVAYQQYKDAIDTIQRIASIVRVAEPELIDTVERIAAERRELEKEVDRLKMKLAQANSDDLIKNARRFGQYTVVTRRVQGVDRAQMRAIAETVRNKLAQPAVVVLGTNTADDTGVSIVATVSKNDAAKVHAGKLVNMVAEKVGGRGGGRADMAEAGGKDTKALESAIDGAFDIVRQMIGDD